MKFLSQLTAMVLMLALFMAAVLLAVWLGTEIIETVRG